MIGALLAFTLASVALLGSPGPGIAALVAVGRSSGLAGGLRFLLAMQVGLALAAGLSALGLVGVLKAIPALSTALTVISICYLVWLAWQIASAPVTGEIAGSAEAGKPSTLTGFVLRVANPKAYLAFASLFGSFVIVEPAFGATDTLTKWIACVIVMIVVDFAWLAAGAGLGRITLAPKAERIMNIAMGAMILIACVLAL